MSERDGSKLRGGKSSLSQGLSKFGLRLVLSEGRGGCEKKTFLKTFC